MEIDKEDISEWLKNLQDKICISLENLDGRSKFKEDLWTREKGGGGRSRIIKDGIIFEQGGVLYSAVHGDVPNFLHDEKEHSLLNLSIKSQKNQFFATGISIVLHPKSPMIPIIHMNIRYFELDNGQKWLGGGIDLTPHYVFEEDAVFFHQELKKICDKYQPTYYNKFKKWADDYFYIPHRHETRGIGGIFFDKLNNDDDISFEKNLFFWKEVGEGFIKIYTEIINRNKNKSFTKKNKHWQLLRRGRYVEFNLVYDKGTRFGLETNGRVESVLMSLPNEARWEYDFKLKKKSEEEKTIKFLKKGINWV